MKTSSPTDRGGESASDLRVKAERRLKQAKQTDRSYESQPPDVLIEELQIHQIELEMQNDELRLVNEQLEQQQMRFATLYDLAPVGFFVINEAGHIKEINQAAIGLLEYGKVKVIDKRFVDYIYPVSLDRFNHFRQQLLNTQQKQNCQLKMRSKAGNIIDVQMEGVLVTHSRQFREFYIAVVDVTERLQAQLNIVEIKERLELALEAASAGTWELDLDSMEFYLDDFDLELCGAGNKFNKTYAAFINLIHPDDRVTVDQHFRSALNNETKVEIECRLSDRDGEPCYASLLGHILLTPGKGRRFMGIMMNITAKKQIELQTEKLKARYLKNIALATLRAEENERKRISSALHDGVSQLLYGVKMKLDLLGKSNADQPLMAVNNLLDMAIKETRDISFEIAPAILADFGLPPTIEEMGSRLDTPAMRIKTSVSGFNERLDLVLETTVFRIVQELVNNCMKHAGASLINVEVRKNKNIEIRVKDNGRGFDVKHQQSSKSGSGLSSIKNKILLYDGTLEINSTPNKGTTIKVCLKPTPYLNVN